VTESLTTDLSRMRGSFVIARNTAFTYKEKSVDVKQIGKELNVRYVLEGSVQRSCGRLRINVQLIDAESAAHLWADRFDKAAADLFDMQDEIVGRLANALSAELVSVEARRAERSPNPDSLDCYFQVMADLNKGIAPKSLSDARRHFERVQSLDPLNVDALIGIGQVDGLLAASAMVDDRAGRLRAAEEALTLALTIAPTHAQAHHLLGGVYIFFNRASRGIAECERSLELDRNLAFAHSTLSISKLTLGLFNDVERHIEDAIRLSPSDPTMFIWLTNVAIAHFANGYDEKAIEWLRRSLGLNQNYNLTHFHLTAALAHLGRLDEAVVVAGAGLALQPSFTIAQYRAAAMSDNPKYLALRERLYDGLRKAGIPEQ
jgi:tetratricopeptide (TPR) repeat protein